MDGTQAEASPSADAGSGHSLTLAEGAERLLPLISEDDAPTSTEEAASGTPSPKQANASDGAPAVTDDTLVALKDGTQVSIRELKRGYVSRKTFTGKTQALAEERHRLEDLQNAVQTRASAVDAMVAALSRAASALMPQRPDPNLIDVEPQTFKALQADFEWKAGLLAEVDRTARIEQQAAMAEAQATERDRQHRWQMELQGERERLFEAMPHLAQPGVYVTWWQAACQTMAGYGFSPAELDDMADHRLYLAVNDLIRMAQARAGSASTRETLKRIPLLKGGRMMDRSAREGASKQREFERLKRTGRLEDAAALIARGL